MYNKFLKYLLENDPKRTISKYGIIIRRIVNPIIRLVMPITTIIKLKILHRAKIPKQPVIFAATHGFKEDIVDTYVVANRQAYILIGSLSQIFLFI